jgi:hypothetical protein
MRRALLEHQKSGFLSALTAACHPDIRCKDWVLREEAPESTLPPVRITQNCAARALLLRPDQAPGQGGANQRLFPLFNSTLSGLTGCCDYVLVSEDPRPEEPLTIVLIELKSSDGRGGAEQIDNAGLLLQSLLEATLWHANLPRSLFRWRSLILAGKAPRGGLHKPGALGWRARPWPLGMVEHAMCRPAACPLSALLT